MLKVEIDSAEFRSHYGPINTEQLEAACKKLLLTQMEVGRTMTFGERNPAHENEVYDKLDAALGEFNDIIAKAIRYE